MASVKRFLCCCCPSNQARGSSLGLMWDGPGAELSESLLANDQVVVGELGLPRAPAQQVHEQRVHSLEQDMNPSARWAGHTARISCVIVASPGCIATGSHDQTVVLWDLFSGERVARLTGHKSSVRCLAARRGRLFSGAQDGALIEWHADTRALVAEVRAHSDTAVSALACCAKWLFTASAQGVAKQWQLGTAGQPAQPVRSFMPGSQPDCRTPGYDPINALACSNTQLLTGSSQVRLWELSSGACTRMFDMHRASVTHLELLGGLVYSAAADGSVHRMELDTGARSCLLPPQGSALSGLSVIGEHLLCCSPEAGHKASVQHWQVEGAKPVLVRRLLAGGEALRGLCSSNNWVVAVGDSHEVLVWELQAGELLDLEGVLMQSERDKTPVPSPRSGQMPEALMHKPELLGSPVSQQDELLELAAQEHSSITAQLAALDTSRRASSQGLASPQVDWAGNQLAAREQAEEQESRREQQERDRREAAAAAQEAARQKDARKAKAAEEAAAAAAAAHREQEAAREAAKQRAAEEAAAAAKAAEEAAKQRAAEEAAEKARRDQLSAQSVEKSATRERKLSKWELERQRQEAAAQAHEEEMQAKAQAAAQQHKIAAAASGMLAGSDTETETETEEEGYNSSSSSDGALAEASKGMLACSESDSEEEPKPSHKEEAVSAVEQFLGGEDTSLEFVMGVLGQVSQKHAAEGDVHESAGLNAVLQAASPKHSSPSSPKGSPRTPPPRSRKAR